MDIDSISIEKLFTTVVLVAVLALVVFFIGFVGFQALVIWYRNRKREEQALKFVLLQVALPRDNEIKIDAAEQMLAALSSIKKGGRFSSLKPQEHISFELIGLPEDIRFYI